MRGDGKNWESKRTCAREGSHYGLMVAATGTMDARPRVAVAGGGEGIIAVKETYVN